ncbi:MAG: acyl-CoA dehydrogenase family protein [Mycobacterium sp.]
MDFNLTGEQELLRDGLTKFLAARYDLAESRSAAKTGAGWQPEIWRAFAEELGILGATFPEDIGGIGGGPTELMVISEALGHALVIEPYVGTVVLAGGLLARADTDAARTLLERITEGTAIVALAQGPGITATADGAGWTLTGEAAVVADAPLATHLLIAADTDRGVGLFLTEFDAATPPAGLTVHAYRTIDDRRAADLELDGLTVSTRLFEDATAELARARDEAAAAVCAEAVGGMRKVLADTVEYCKQRQQFGQPIGSFQVLQHRMVDMSIEVEQAVAAVYLAILNLGADAPEDRARAVSAAKATVGRAARFVGQNAVQLHGGMGMTEELAIGHYFKRLTAVQYEFGSTDYHLSRYATITRPGA